MAQQACLPLWITNFNRVQLLTALPKGGKAIELGTYRGGFAVKLLRVIDPEELHLVDPWALDEDDAYLRTYGGQRSAMHSAYDQVQRVFQEEIASGRVALHRAYSRDVASQFSDRHFDLIYIDAMHDYDNVRADLLTYKDKLKTEGFILGHDFSNTYMSRAKKFGIIRAVREFTDSEDFDLILITNEAAPTYLLARSDNESTLPDLRHALLSHPACSLIEIDASLLDRFDQVAVETADGRKGQMFRFS